MLRAHVPARALARSLCQQPRLGHSVARAHGLLRRHGVQPQRQAAPALARCLSSAPVPSAPEQEQQQHERPAETWVERYLPTSWQPYARLARADRPIGTLLLLWPCYWSLALASPSAGLDVPPLRWLVTFGVGALIMRGAGCTINDMWDHRVDKHVARTRTRPLASGEISAPRALGFLAAQLTAGLGVLLTFDVYSIVLGACSLGFVATYPAFKRFTYWPQAMLGLTFNWGALLGWSALHKHVEWSVCLPLYTAGVCWTMVYDTIYAHQDKHDDKRLGLKSTALLFGSRTPRILAGFGTSMIAMLAASGYATTQGPLFWASLGVAARHMWWQIATVDLDDPRDCFAKFLSNREFGGLVFAGILAGNIWRPSIHGVAWPDLPVWSLLA